MANQGGVVLSYSYYRSAAREKKALTNNVNHITSQMSFNVAGLCHVVTKINSYNDRKPIIFITCNFPFSQNYFANHVITDCTRN